MTQEISNAENIHYTVHIQNPNTHYAYVEMIIRDVKDKLVEVRMPVWTPGSYLVREFEKNVESVQALAGNTSLSVKKKDKSTWLIDNPKGQKEIRVSYQVYCFEASVRTSYIDADHAFLLPSSCLMYTNQKSKGSIEFQYPETWTKLSCTLDADANKPNFFTFQSYDDLADSPVEIGNQVELGFEVAGVPHRVAMVGENNCEAESFVSDLKKVCQGMFDVMGTHPCKSYLFIVHHVESGGGGLEHANSNVVQMPRFAYSNKETYLKFLGLCGHEYFHLWNVKRIRPIELGPFDYSKENYTSLLWVAEGITSYYDELIMFRQGFINQEQYLKTFAQTLSAVLNRKGAELQSMHASSFDAWIKEYRPNENSINTAVSYYSKGTVLAAMLDIEIIGATEGKKSLDDLMRYLYDTYYIKKGRGFTEQEFYAAIDLVSGKSLQFKEWAENPNNSALNDKIAALFKSLDCQIENKAKSNPYYTGINTEIKNNRVFVKSIDGQSPAFGTDIQAGDEIIAINHIRVLSGIEEILKLSEEKNQHILISRNGLIRELQIVCGISPMIELSIAINNAKNPYFKLWMKRSEN